MSGYLDALSDDEKDFLVRLAKSGDLVAEEFHVLPAADGCAPSLPESDDLMFSAINSAQLYPHPENPEASSAILAHRSRSAMSAS